ncbi:hypothetical protein GCM10022198_16140 [Klugiella xanthotipulae]
MPLAGEIMIDGAQDTVRTYGILLGGLIGLGYSIRCGITPFGIEISPQGVRWQSWGKKTDIPWHDIHKVELGIFKLSRSILLRDRTTGAAHYIDISTMGSDPTIIAETIAYFLAHPKDRDALEDPLTALSLVIETTKTRQVSTT